MIRIGSDKIPYIDLGNNYKIRLEWVIDLSEIGLEYS
jgi:hypothetical protein